jgi:tetratricopeptide (TPR) repeat protein
MSSSTESFWSEIKMYEERLKADPSSYCFAPLAEVYLQAGLLDDALAVSRTGVSKHPGYADGQMALARVCHQKGLVDECRRALETVATAVPGHAEAQRLLARLYKESGNDQAALQALQTLLDFNPDDMSARIELESLQQRVSAVSDDDDLELIELTEADIYEEPEDVGELVERIKPVPRTVEDPWSGINAVAPEVVPSPTALEAVWSVPEQQLAATVVPPVEQDPLTTSTLAELYVSQGFSDKAIEIYRRIVAADPQNIEAVGRLAELEQSEIVAETAQAAVVVAELAPAPNLPVEGVADQQAAVTVLEGWLENIRRLRVCR